MREYLCMAIVGAALIAAPASAAVVDFGASEPDAVTASEAAWQSSIDEAKAEGQTVSISAMKQDLNGDGKPEIIGQVKSTFLCGNQGPCVFVMAMTGANYDVIFSVPGVEKAEVLDSKTRGWLDLQLNEDDKYKYNGSTYKAE